ncbi:MAG TPA: response regulator [Polyangia bacterium]|nr:response regulator [Polyangia bacterium]
MRGLRLLVVEDDDMIREALTDLLRDEGAVVTPAQNGREALQQLRGAHAIDLILLDLMMPVMDGWEFRVEQRADPQLAPIPLIAMSADMSAKARAIAADAYLRKPLDFSELVGRIRSVVDHAAAERAAAADTAATFATMAAEIAHEINNPLTYLMANLQVLAERLPPAGADHKSQELQELIADALDGADRIRRIVKDAQREPEKLRRH